MKVVLNILLVTTLIILAHTYVMPNPSLPYRRCRLISRTSKSASLTLWSPLILSLTMGRDLDCASPAGALPSQVRRAKMVVYEVTPTKVKYLWGVGANPEEQELTGLSVKLSSHPEGSKPIFSGKVLMVRDPEYAAYRVLSRRWRPHVEQCREASIDQGRSGKTLIVIGYLALALLA